MYFAPNVPEHKGFVPIALGRKDFALAALEHKDFGVAVLGQKEAEPVALRHKDFVPAAIGLDLDLSLAKFDPIDMSIRVTAAQVDLVAARVNLAAVKVVPTHAEVDLAKA